MILLTLLACLPDDYTGPKDDTASTDDTAADTAGDTSGAEDTGETGGGDTSGGDTLALVGDWLSEGEDLSPLLQAGDIVRVDATFSADGSYVVTARDDAGEERDFVGTYVADDATAPGSITLTQSSPYQATSVGIWEVEGTTLTFEVAQTFPDYGWSPPTPQGGFGSTSGSTLEPGDNVQVYVRP